MANNLGDFDASAVIYGKFTTVQSTGAPYTLAGTPALSVYKDNSTTESTSGVTLTVDFDSRTGFNHFTIDTSSDGTFYSAGSFFNVVITAGTVNSISVVGYTVGAFTIRKTSALKPTTASRTLDVSSTGEAGIDWANIGSPTTSQNLSGTTVKAVTDRVTANVDQIDGVAWSTHAAGMAPADLRDISGSAVSTSTAQLGVNVVNVKGSASAGAAGYIGIDWSAINAPTTTVNLSGTTIKAVTDAVGANVTQWSGSAVAAPNVAGVPVVDVSYFKGTASAGAAGYAGIDWSAINAPTTTVNLSGTTIKTATDLATAIAALPTASQNAVALLTYTDGVETGITPQGAWRVILAATSGVSDGFTGFASTIHYRDSADTKNVITATVDAVGNRSSVTLDTA